MAADGDNVAVLQAMLANSSAIYERPVGAVQIDQ
jgi:hypothetical protein